MTGSLEIKRDKDFDRNLLPKINALAAKQNKTRSDISRDILCSRSDYEPEPRSPAMVNKDRIIEQQVERSYNAVVFWY
jgi:hypothetical protein